MKMSEFKAVYFSMIRPIEIISKTKHLTIWEGFPFSFELDTFSLCYKRLSSTCKHFFQSLRLCV